MEAATGYALRSFHCALHPHTKEDNHSGNPYTYPQPVLLQAGLHPGSKLDRRGGSKFIRRRQDMLSPVYTTPIVVELRGADGVGE